MPTSRISLDVNQYVRVNIGLNPLTIEAKNGDIRVCMTQYRPATTNGAYITVDNRTKHTINHLDANVWVFSDVPSVQAVVEEQVGGGLTGGMGRGITVNAWGTAKAVQDYSIIHGMWTFDVPPSMWIIEENGTEVSNGSATKATSTDGLLKLTSGATADDTTEVFSRRHARYQPDRGLLYAASIGFPDASLDGIAKAGLFVGEENGVYFKTKGDGKLYACVTSDSVEIKEEVISFPFPIDITKGNVYDIQMQWRGVGNIKFFAGNPGTGALQHIHTITFLNTLDEALSVQNPAFSASFYVKNISTEVSLWCGCVDISAEGGREEVEQYGSVSSTITVSSGDPVIALFSPLTINSLTNTRDLRLARITVSADKKCTIGAYKTRDSTAITGGSFSTFKVGSYIESNTTITSVDDTKMALFSSFKVPAGGTIERENPSRETIDFYIVQGDYIVIACISGSVVEIDVTIEFGEQI